MKKPQLFQRLLPAIYHYLLFFMLVAFLVSCTMSLFVSTLANDLGLVLTGEDLGRAAKLTFLSVILLSMLFTAIDAARRRLTSDKIIRRIAEATAELAQGKFEARIAPAGRIGISEDYDRIIDCFNKIARELGSLETLRTDFIANVSHEMKTPLAVIQNYGTLLQEPDLSAEKRIEYARCVTDGSRRLADMMTNILRLNRLENQQIYPMTNSVDLGEQLCECLLQYESVWEREGISLETEIGEGITVQTDSELLGLVWSNLFSNAFKFTPSGGTVFVSLTEEDGFAVVRVRDTGCGMSAEVGVRIFEKFYQGDSSHTVQGNGLGLALVKRVIDILHGEISVESIVDKGSTFTVKLRRP